jgi:hypothetical protein
MTGLAVERRRSDRRGRGFRNPSNNARVTVDSVDVRDEKHRRLRLAARQHAPRDAPAEEPAVAHGAPCLREDVEREGVARDGRAHRSARDPSSSGERERREAAAVDANLLRGTPPPHAQPSRIRWRWTKIQSGAASSPPETVEPLERRRYPFQRASSSGPAHHRNVCGVARLAWPTRRRSPPCLRGRTPDSTSRARPGRTTAGSRGRTPPGTGPETAADR